MFSSATAQRYGLKVGDPFLVQALGGEHRLTVVGIVRHTITLRAFGGAYVSMPVAEKISGQSARINRVDIDLKDKVAAADFESRWRQRFEQSTPTVSLTSLDDLAAEYNEGRSLAILEQQRFYATGVAVLADVHFGTPVTEDGWHIRFSYASSFEAIEQGLDRLQDFMKKNTR